MRRFAAPVLAIVAGLLWSTAFDRRPLLVAVWILLVPLLLLLSDRRAGRLAFLHGLAFWLASIPWIAPTLATFGDLPRSLAVALLLLLAAYLALYGWLFGRLGRRLWRAGGWLALLGLPALWTGLEWLRAHLLSGFPWNLAGYSWIGVPGALPLAAWCGALGVSFVVVFANCGIALAWARRRWEWAALGVLAPLVLLAVAGRADEPSLGPPATRRTAVPVRVVQPDIPVSPSFAPAAVEAGYQRLLAMSRRACPPSGALLVWPESAAWPSTWQRDARLRRDLLGLAGAGCPVLFNTVVETPRGPYNSASLVGPRGVVGRYDKRHLVPFGEYVPLARLLPFVGTLARNAGQFLAADELRLLPYRGERIGVAICFEITFPEEVAELERAGATLLVTVTNDAWYGDTAAPWQHFRAARFRAAELRRPLVRAALTGVSGIIAPDGSVRGELGVDTAGVLAADLEPRDDRTPYGRFPWLVPAASWLLALSAIFWTYRS